MNVFSLNFYVRYFKKGIQSRYIYDLFVYAQAIEIEYTSIKVVLKPCEPINMWMDKY